MRLLLDTHLLLWAMARTRRLPKAARAAILDPGNEVYFSAASIWEVAIKSALGRPEFKAEPAALASALAAGGFLELPVTAVHAARVAALPAHHRDPFDRMLVAQAGAEPMTLFTNDALLAKYDAPIQVVLD